MKRGIYIVQCKNASANTPFQVRLLKDARPFHRARNNRPQAVPCLHQSCVFARSRHANAPSRSLSCGAIQASANVPTSRFHGNSLIANVTGIFSRAIGLKGFHIAADNRIREALRRCASEVARKRTGHFRKSAGAEKIGRKRSDTPR